jgi:DNA polymerase-3 subunit gamma/tau
VPDSGEPAPSDTGPVPRQDHEAEEERMLAEASSDTSEVVRRDPEEVAIELLQNELGAKRIDRG